MRKLLSTLSLAKLGYNAGEIKKKNIYLFMETNHNLLIHFINIC